MTTPLRLGVVGAGHIAHIAQLPTLVNMDGVELTALVERRPDAELVKRRWGFSSTYLDLDEMLALEQPDAVFVLTPRALHAPAVRAALSAGAHVFCEKPLATTAEEAVALADLAERTGRILMVDFNRRYAPSYVAARAAFGIDGAQFCVAQKNRPGSEYRATFENAIHMVDLLRWFCGGEPTAVHAYSAGEDLWEEDGVGALIRFDTGNTGVLMAARRAGAWCERLDAYGAMTSAEVIAPDRVTITHDATTSVREMSPEYYGWATATETFGFAESVRQFIDCVRTGQQPLTSGREAARTQTLLEQILKTAELPVVEQEGRAWRSHAVKEAR